MAVKRNKHWYRSSKTDRQFYATTRPCNPAEMVNCDKTGCYINGGPCYRCSPEYRRIKGQDIETFLSIANKN